MGRLTPDCPQPMKRDDRSLKVHQSIRLILKCSGTPINRTPIYRTPIYRTLIYRTPIYRTPIYRTPIYRTPIYRISRRFTGPASLPPFSLLHPGLNSHRFTELVSFPVNQGSTAVNLKVQNSKVPNSIRYSNINSPKRKYNYNKLIIKEQGLLIPIVWTV